MYKRLLKACATSLTVTAFSLLLLADAKPRVYVEGRGTTNASTQSGAGATHHYGWITGARSDTTIDAHDETMEIVKNLSADCPQVTVTLNPDAADYIVKLNRESKAKKGLMSKTSQVLVANKEGDVLTSDATITVRGAAKGACAVIVSDWSRKKETGQPLPPVNDNEQRPPRHSSERSTQYGQGTGVETDIASHTRVSDSTEKIELPRAEERGTGDDLEPLTAFGLSVRVSQNVDVEGIEITNVVSGSAAEAAGLHAGYVIRSVEAKRVQTPSDLVNAFGARTQGSEFRLVYLFRTALGWMTSERVLKLGASTHADQPQPRSAIDMRLESPPKSARGGVWVSMTRTNSHVNRSSVQQALAIQDDAYKFLREQHITLATDEQSADQVLHLMVDRPVSKWVEVLITLSGRDERVLWHEKASYASWATVTGKGAGTVVSSKIREILQKHLTELSTPVRALATEVADTSSAKP